MNITQLQQRAIEIREKYARLETQKYGKAWTNSQIMEGFVGDVGDLMKLVMAKEGIREQKEDIDQKLAHELSDCLWSILVLAEKYNLNLEGAFIQNMDTLEKQIDSESSPA